MNPTIIENACGFRATSNRLTCLRISALDMPYFTDLSYVCQTQNAKIYKKNPASLQVLLDMSLGCKVYKINQKSLSLHTVDAATQASD